MSPVGNANDSCQYRAFNVPKLPPQSSTVRLPGKMEVSLLTDVRAEACKLSDLLKTIT